VRRIKASLKSLGPEVNAARMVRDYVDNFYNPTAAHADRLTADDYAHARKLAAWKRRVQDGWDDVAVLSVEMDASVANLGVARAVDAEVSLGALGPDDVSVQ